MAIAPKVTVVTVVFNGATYLLDCLQSVASQTGIRVEHVVIDGGSTDGSVDLLTEWSDRLAFWSSEPDSGIADAMNKGIGRATGEWVLFLHADDYLRGSDALASAAVYLTDGVGIAAFPVLFGSTPPLQLILPRPAGFLLNFKLGFCHQGVFTRRELFSRLGVHDCAYKISMDYDFVLRCYRQEAVISAFSSPILSVMRDNGISSRYDWPSLRNRFSEERAIHFRNAGGTASRLAYRLYWFCYLPYRRLRSALGR